jgi:hypothetical protein
VLTHIADHLANRIDDFSPWNCNYQPSEMTSLPSGNAIIDQITIALKTPLSGCLLN